MVMSSAVQEYRHKLRVERADTQEKLHARKRAAREIRDSLNWLAVFEHEYDLPPEVSEQIRMRLMRIAEHIKNI